MNLLPIIITGEEVEVSKQLRKCFQPQHLVLQQTAPGELLAVFKVKPAHRIIFAKTLKEVFSRLPVKLLTSKRPVDPERYERLFELSLADYDSILARKKLPPGFVPGNPQNNKDYSVIWSFAADLSHKLRRPATVEEIKAAWNKDFIMRNWGNPDQWNIEWTARAIANHPKYADRK